MSNRFDLIVIGGGSGGVRAARKASEQGRSVLLFESAKLGGTCVNVGCVPKKILSYASHAPDDLTIAASFGWKGIPDVKHDWPLLRDKIANYLLDLNGIYQTNLEKAKVDYKFAKAKLTGSNEIEVDGEKYTAEKILIATGATPVVPNIPGMHEYACVSDDMFSLKQMPTSAIVAGAGYIAVEFACILAGFGVKTTLVHRGDTVLKNFDSSVQKHLLDQMRQHKVNLQLNTTIAKLEKTSTGVCAHFDGGQTLEAGLLLSATGRSPNIAGLGLEEIGVEIGKRGEIVVNEKFQTSVPSVYALGDVIGRLALTPVAIAEGMLFVAQNYGGYGPEINYDLIPTTVFSHPNIGSIGLTEQQAREKHPDCEVADATFTPMKTKLAGMTNQTYYKLIYLPDNGKVLGAHMVGPDAGETMQGFSVAMLCGATKYDFDATIGIHPTSAEEFVSMR